LARPNVPPLQATRAQARSRGSSGAFGAAKAPPSSYGNTTNAGAGVHGGAGGPSRDAQPASERDRDPRHGHHAASHHRHHHASHHRHHHHAAVDMIRGEEQVRAARAATQQRAARVGQLAACPSGVGLDHAFLSYCPLRFGSACC
jgi:hypothetical protein